MEIKWRSYIKFSDFFCEKKIIRENQVFTRILLWYLMIYFNIPNYSPKFNLPKIKNTNK